MDLLPPFHKSHSFRQSKFDKMTTNFRRIRILFKPSPSLVDTYRPRDWWIEISLHDTIHHSRLQLSSLLRCDEKCLWLYHGDCVFTTDVDQGLRWFHVPDLSKDPTVFFYHRAGLPKFISTMCLVEIKTLRHKCWLHILSLGWNPDPCKMTPSELDFIRVAAAAVSLQEHTGSFQEAIHKTIWRYLVCTRLVKNPSDAHVQRISQQLNDYVRSEFGQSKCSISKHCGETMLPSNEPGKGVHWKDLEPSASNEEPPKLEAHIRPSRSNDDSPRPRPNFRRDWPLHNLQHPKSSKDTNEEVQTLAHSLVKDFPSSAPKRPDPPAQQCPQC